MWALAISPPLLHTVNRIFGTIWTKLPNISQCPLSKIASFVSTERFSLLYAFNSALYMLQNPLTVLSFIGRLFDPNFLATAAGPLMQYTSQFWIFLDLNIFSMAFVSFVFWNLMQLQQQLHNQVNPDLIRLVHSAWILCKKRQFFKKRIMNFFQGTVS